MGVSLEDNRDHLRHFGPVFVVLNPLAVQNESLSQSERRWDRDPRRFYTMPAALRQQGMCASPWLLARRRHWRALERTSVRHDWHVSCFVAHVEACAGPSGWIGPRPYDVISHVVNHVYQHDCWVRDAGVLLLGSRRLGRTKHFLCSCGPRCTGVWAGAGHTPPDSVWEEHQK
jgi:hypothetical protein